MLAQLTVGTPIITGIQSVPEKNDVVLQSIACPPNNNMAERQINNFRIR